MANFHERLQELMDDRCLGMCDLQRKAGISKSQTSRWLRYGMLPSVRSLVRLADYFQCSVDYIGGLTDDAEPPVLTFRSSFPARLHMLIYNRDKINIHQLFLRTHIETSILCNYLNKGRLPSFYNLQVLCDAFECSADYLLGRTVA